MWRDDTSGVLEAIVDAAKSEGVFDVDHVRVVYVGLCLDHPLFQIQFSVAEQFVWASNFFQNNGALIQGRPHEPSGGETSFNPIDGLLLSAENWPGITAAMSVAMVLDGESLSEDFPGLTTGAQRIASRATQILKERA